MRKVPESNKRESQSQPCCVNKKYKSSEFFSDEITRTFFLLIKVLFATAVFFFSVMSAEISRTRNARI